MEHKTGKSLPIVCVEKLKFVLVQHHGRSFICENSEELKKDEDRGEAMIQNL